MKEEKEEMAVVTIRCIDMPVPHVDSWKRKCDICGEMTWISASWKGKQVDKVVCEPCWFANYKDREDYNIYITQKNLDEFLEWCERNNKKSSKEEAIRLMELRTGKKIKILSTDYENM